MIDRAPLERLARFIVVHRAATITMGAVVTCVLALGIGHLRLEVDPDLQLPQQHPFVRTYNEVTRLFGDRNTLIVTLSPITGDIFQADFLSTLRAITEELSELPGCTRPLLKGLASPATRHISVAGNVLDVQPAIPPVLSDAQMPELRARVLSDPLLLDTLVSEDGAATAIYATFELTPDTPGYIDVFRRAEIILQRHEKNGIVSHLAGPIAVVATLTEYSQRALFLLPLSLLVIAIVHYEAFRTWTGVLLPILTGILGVIWSMGIMGYAGVSIDPINATTPVLILAIGAGHAVQILKRYYEHYSQYGDPRDAVVASLTQSGQATLASCTIAALSFASLATLQTQSMRTFGIFTALGIVCVLAIEFSLMPAIRACSGKARAPTPSSQESPFGGPLLERLGHKLAGRRAAYFILAAYGVAVLCSLHVTPHLTTNSSLVRQFPDTAPIRRATEFINSRFSGSSFLIVLIEGKTAGSLATPSALHAINSLERKIELLPTVGRVVSIVDTLSVLHRALHASTSPSTAELPSTQELIEQYLLLYSMSGGNDLNTMITPDYGAAKLIVFLKDDSTRLGQSTIRGIMELSDTTLSQGLSVRVAGTVASDIALTEVMVEGKLANIIQIAAISTVISSVIFRSVIVGLLVCAPLALSVLLNFVLMWLLAIPLDVTTSAASAMAVGLGADYAIYMMFRIREELFRGHSTEAALGIAMATAGQAILLVAVAIGLGYSVLCFAGFAIYVNLGMLIGASMASSSLASITVIPAFVTIWLQVRPGALFADGTKLTGPAAAVSPWDADQKVRAK